MSRPKPQPATRSGSKTRTPSNPPQADKHVNFPAGDYEMVDPIWLLKAGALTLGVAALLTYASICFYISYGAWQNFLHPSSTVAQTPAVAYIPIRFDAVETGTPRLTGWWIPADGIASAAAPTLLYLHDGDGSLGDTVAALNALHSAGANVFAIDYRGYGQSQGPHPTEQTMAEDSGAALDYLMNTRHLAAGTIVPFGDGLGAVLAAQLVQHHPELPAVAIENPDPDAAQKVIDDPRYRLLPIRLLLHDWFDIRSPLAGIHQPKLLISTDPEKAEPASSAGLSTFFRSLPDPKRIVSGLPQDQAGSELSKAVSRFLDEYVKVIPAAAGP